ncbi:MAG TPA: hypothetical protein VGK46_13565, partial [Saprospiraceae bacterium]
MLKSFFRITLLFLFSLGIQYTFGQTTHNVVWSDIVGCTVSGNTLTKNIGDGWGNSAATGLYYLDANTDGFLEYTVDVINRKAFGLSDINANNFTGSIDYGIIIGSDAKAYMMNSSIEMANTPIIVGDVLRIERIGSSVYYKKNGTTIYTLTGGLTVPLLVDVSLYTNGAALVNMKTSFGPSAHPVLQWTSVKGMSISGDNLYRTLSYFTGYGDAGASSVIALPAGENGWVETILTEVDRRKVIGFASSNVYTHPGGIAVALQFDNDNVHAFENGVQGAYLGKFTANAVLRMSREGSQIKFYINDVLRYTSPSSHAGALYVQVGFFNQWGSFKNIYASFGSGQGSVPDRIEYEAIKKFYDSLGGPAWTTKTNWPAGTWSRHKYNTEFNNWFGLTIQNGDVTSINIPANNLTGFIPSSIGNLKKVNYLRLYNNHIGGKIPTTIGNLTDLTLLQLGLNQLTGTIPPSLGNLTNLTWLGLYYNSLTGTLPASLFSLPKLEYLYITRTQITGQIPAQINLPKMRLIHLNTNDLRGPIPASIGSLPATLSSLSLGNNSLMGGSLPPEIGNLSGLTELWLNNNGHTGSIPYSFGNLTQLRYVQMAGNQLSGEIPKSFKNLTNIEWIALSENQLSGNIPGLFGRMTKMDSLWLANNQFSGLLPDSLQYTTTLATLVVYNNKLSGSIPAWIGGLPIRSLLLGTNDFTGTLPTQYQNFSNIRNFDVSHTKITGAIPSALTIRPTLRLANFSNSNFTTLEDLSSRAIKANLNLKVNVNKIPISEIERYFTGPNIHPFDSLFYGSQQLAHLDTIRTIENSPLNISAPSGGVHGVYT